MTVRETLLFSSKLRNHPWVPAEKREERVSYFDTINFVIIVLT